MRFLSFPVETSIDPYLIAALSSAGLVPATPGSAAIGIASEVGAVAGKTGDAAVRGLGVVRLGGSVLPGQFLTTDSTGRAVTAQSGDRTVGIALSSGVAGQVCPLIICPGTLSGGGSPTVPADLALNQAFALGLTEIGYAVLSQAFELGVDVQPQSLHPYVSDYVSRVQTAGGTVDGARAQALSDWCNAGASQGWLTALKFIWIAAANLPSGAVATANLDASARVPFLAPSGFPSSIANASNGSGFLQNQNYSPATGLAGNFTGCLNTGYVPTAQGMTGTTGLFGVFVKGTVPEGSGHGAGLSTGGSAGALIYPYWSDNNSYTRLYSNGGTSATNGDGMWLLNRYAGSVTSYKGATALYTDGNADTAVPDLPIALMARCFGAGAYDRIVATHRLYLAIAGVGFDQSLVAGFNSATQALATALIW